MPKRAALIFICILLCGINTIGVLAAEYTYTKEGKHRIGVPVTCVVKEDGQPTPTPTKVPTATPTPTKTPVVPWWPFVPTSTPTPEPAKEPESSGGGSSGGGVYYVNVVFRDYNGAELKKVTVPLNSKLEPPTVNPFISNGYRYTFASWVPGAPGVAAYDGYAHGYDTYKAMYLATAIEGEENVKMTTSCNCSCNSSGKNSSTATSSAKTQSSANASVTKQNNPTPTPTSTPTPGAKPVEEKTQDVEGAKFEKSEEADIDFEKQKEIWDDVRSKKTPNEYYGNTTEPLIYADNLTEEGLERMEELIEEEPEEEEEQEVESELQDSPAEDREAENQGFFDKYVKNWKMWAIIGPMLLLLMGFLILKFTMLGFSVKNSLFGRKSVFNGILFMDDNKYIDVSCADPANKTHLQKVINDANAAGKTAAELKEEVKNSGDKTVFPIKTKMDLKIYEPTGGLKKIDNLDADEEEMYKYIINADGKKVIVRIYNEKIKLEEKFTFELAKGSKS